MSKRKYIKWSNELIDEKLKEDNRPIKRIGNYGGIETPIDFLCLIDECQCIWKARLYSIFRGSGCPRCAGKLPLTREIAAERYRDTGFELVGEWISTKSPTLIRHKKCGYEWNPVPYNIFRGMGCPQCSKILQSERQKLPVEEVIMRFNEFGYELLGEYVGRKTPTLTKHIKCGFEWKVRPGDIFSSYGCPQCAGLLPLTQEIVYQRFKDKGYELLGKYKNNFTPILTKHKECGFEWKVRPGDIFSSYGCPQCATSKNEKLIGKLLEDTELIVDTQKGVKYSSHQNKRRMFFDFYLPEINTVIEYNGEQHYRPVCFGGISQERAKQNFLIQQVRDQRKQQYCDDNNITIICIDGRKYKSAKLEQYMQEELIPRLQEMKLEKVGT
jgi:hypothetical protein